MRVLLAICAATMAVGCERQQSAPVVAASSRDAGVATAHVKFALPESAKGGPESGGGDPSANQIGEPSNVLGNAINAALADGGIVKQAYALPESAEHGPGIAQPDSRENTHVELRLRDAGLVDPANYHFGEDSADDKGLK